MNDFKQSENYKKLFSQYTDLKKTLKHKVDIFEENKQHLTKNEQKEEKDYFLTIEKHLQFLEKKLNIQ